MIYVYMYVCITDKLEKVSVSFDHNIFITNHTVYKSVNLKILVYLNRWRVRANH